MILTEGFRYLDLNQLLFFWKRYFDMIRIREQSSTMDLIWEYLEALGS